MRKLLPQLLVLVLLCTTLAGCWDLRPIENLAMFLMLAFDLAPNGTDLIITATYPTFGMGASSPIRTVGITAGDLSHGLRLLQTDEDKITVAGKVIVYVLGESVWRSGRITELARQAYVRPDLSLTGFVVCAQGNASEIPPLKPPDENVVAIALWERLGKLQREGLVPRVNLLQVARLGQMQKDLWIPLIKPVKELSDLLYAGSVAFSRGQPAVVLDVRETADLTSLSGLAPFNHLQSKQQGGTPVSGVFSTVKTKVKRNEEPDGGLAIDVTSSFGLRLSTPVDFSVGSLIDTKQKASIIEADMTGRGQKILDKLRAADSDPLGLSVVSPFAGVAKARDTRDRYQFATIRYRAKVKVMGVGSV